MSINVFATCDSCGISEHVRSFAPGTPHKHGQAWVTLLGKDFLLPGGWSVGHGPYGTCFCSQTCVDKHEAESVVEEIRQLQVKLEQIRARAIRNAQGDG